MPKNKVSDPITDQEMAFARLVLSGTMTDQRAAEAAGLYPKTAAYIKSKPQVRAYMLEHRARTQQQLLEQEAEGLRRFTVSREQVLDRLWEIANMSSETTRGSITGQVKALSMIVAIEGLIPDRRAGSVEKQPAPPAAYPPFDVAAWRRNRQEETDPALAQEEDGLGVSQPEPEPGSAADAPPDPSPEPFSDPTPDLEPVPSSVFDPGQPAFANSSIFSETPLASYADNARDARAPFSIQKNRFGRRR
jgi:hypothetical protein